MLARKVRPSQPQNAWVSCEHALAGGAQCHSIPQPSLPAQTRPRGQSRELEQTRLGAGVGAASELAGGLASGGGGVGATGRGALATAVPWSPQAPRWAKGRPGQVELAWNVVPSQAQ
jgi:hypothetical protein